MDDNLMCIYIIETQSTFILSTCLLHHLGVVSFWGWRWCAITATKQRFWIFELFIRFRNAWQWAPLSPIERKLKDFLQRLVSCIMRHDRSQSCLTVRSAMIASQMIQNKLYTINFVLLSLLLFSFLNINAVAVQELWCPPQNIFRRPCALEN